MSSSVKNQNKGNRLPSIWDGWFGDFFDHAPLPAAFSNDLPAVNVKETEKAWELEAALPGMKKEDISIQIENGLLSIHAESRSQKENKEKAYTRKEFSYQSFNRSFRLPENADEDAIEASYENGVLELILPKISPELPSSGKIIDIR
jgi:HSP20 family protein